MGRWLKKVQECRREAPTKLTELGLVGFVSLPSDRFREIAQVELATTAANDQVPTSREWLEAVARKLGTDADDLLANRHLDLNDLKECAGCDTDQVAHAIRHTPAWIFRTPSVERRVDYTSEAISELQHVIHSAATASSEWRTVRDSYYNHLMSCRACHAPSKRYCSEGMELRHNYNNMPAEGIK